MADLTGLVAQAVAGMAQLTAARTALMPATCTVTRPADNAQTPTLDADGTAPDPAGPTVYDGPCSMVNPKLPPLRNRTVQDQAASPEQRELRTPLSADLETGDVVTMTSSAYAPGIVGDRFVVVREDERTNATYRRYICRGSSWQA